MEKINFVRVIAGGILASVAFIIVEFIVEGLLYIIIGFKEAELARQYFPNIILTGIRYQVINIIYLVATCTFGIWLYAALRPKFGDSLKTAFMSSILILIVIFLYMLNNLNMGILPLKPALISLALGIAEFPVSIVTGALIYKPKA